MPRTRPRLAQGSLAEAFAQGSLAEAFAQSSLAEAFAQGSLAEACSGHPDLALLLAMLVDHGRVPSPDGPP